MGLLLMLSSTLWLIYSHTCSDEMLPLCKSLESPALRKEGDSPCIAVGRLSVSFSNIEGAYTSCGFSLSAPASAISLDPYAGGLSRVYPATVSTASYLAGASNFDSLHDPLTPKERYVLAMAKSYQTTSLPKLSWPSETSKRYTVLMVDAGKGAGNGSNDACEMKYLHWLVMNVQGSDLSTGTTISAYVPPTSHELQPHTYIVSVYEQTGSLDGPTLAKATAEFTIRTAFKKQNFVHTYFTQTDFEERTAAGLKKPIAMNWMKMSFDDSDPFRLAATGLSATYGSGCNLMPAFIGAEAKTKKLDEVLPLSGSAGGGLASALDVTFTHAKEITYTSCGHTMVAAPSSVTLNPLSPASIYNSGMAMTYHTESAPTLYWKHDKKKFYTVLMVDVGTAHRGFEARYLNWMVMNVEGIAIESASTVAAYFGPVNYDLEPHTYVIAIYEQAGFLKSEIVTAAVAAYRPEDKRYSFNTQEFSSVYASHLNGGTPLAINWMSMQFDAYSPTRLASTGLAAKYGTGCSAEKIGRVVSSVRLESQHHTTGDGGKTNEGIMIVGDGTGISTSWIYQAAGAVHTSPTAASNGASVIVAAENMLYSVNATTGVLLWTFAADSTIRSSPTVIGDAVVFGSLAGNVYSVAAASGAKNWQYTLPSVVGAGTSNVVGAAAAARGRAVRGPVTGQLSGWLPNQASWLADTTTYRSSASHAGEASNILSMEVGSSWTAMPSDQEQWILWDMQADHILDGLQIRFDGSAGGTLPTSCAIQTSSTIHGPWKNVATFTPIKDPDTAQVFMFDSEDSGSSSSRMRSRYWRLTFPNTVGGRTVDPARVHYIQWYGMSLTSSQLLFFGSDDGYCYCTYKVDGSLRWRTYTGGKVWGGVAVAQSMTGTAAVAYVGSFSQKVLALDAVTGDQLWERATEGAIVSSPTLHPHSDLVFVGCTEGFIYAIHTSTSASWNAGDIKWRYGGRRGAFTIDDWPRGSITTAIAVSNILAKSQVPLVMVSTITTVLALVASTGEPKWQHIPGGPVSAAPRIEKSMRYALVAAGDGSAAADSIVTTFNYGESLEAVTTTNRYSRSGSSETTHTHTHRHPETLPEQPSHTHTHTTTTEGSFVSAISLVDGKMLWRFNSTGSKSLHGTPLDLGRDGIVFAGNDGVIRSITSRSGCWGQGNPHGACHLHV